MLKAIAGIKAKVIANITILKQIRASLLAKSQTIDHISEDVIICFFILKMSAQSKADFAADKI